MKKTITTMVCAFAVLAFATTARTHDDWLDDDHIDDPENGKYVFWDEEEMMEFLDEYVASLASTAEEDEGDKGLDSCTFQRPIAYAVSTYHTHRPAPHWHVDIDVAFVGSGSEWDYHRVCLNKEVHMYSNVRGLRTHWRTTLAQACDYCSWNTWNSGYMTSGFSWIHFPNKGCYYVWPPNNHIVYWGEEPDISPAHTFQTHLKSISGWGWGTHGSQVVGHTNCP